MFVRIEDLKLSEMNESSSSELRKLAQVAAKTLGIKFTETADSFKPLMGAQFEITEKDYRKIVSAFKRAGSDPEELGFYDMTFDNHDMTVLIDFEDVDDSIQFYVPSMNESVDPKTFIKDLTKATGIKAGRDSEVFENNTGEIQINAYELAKFKFGIIRVGSYGNFKFKKVSLDGYYTVKTVLEYNGDEYNINFRSNGSSRLSPPNAKPVVDQILKDLGIREDVQVGKIRNYPVIDVSLDTYNKLSKINPGDVFGDFIVDKTDGRPNGIFTGNPFMIEVVTPKGFAELVFRNAESLNESTEINEITGNPKYKMSIPLHML